MKTFNADEYEREVFEKADSVTPKAERKANGKEHSEKNTDTKPSWRDHCYSAAELRRRTFPPVAFCVPDLIPEGLTLIAGKPKIGKSWLALDVCIAVALGWFCLGERKPVQGSVLYAAMEDNPRRLQRRIDKLLSPFVAAWPEGLMLANTWRRLDQGGVDDIRAWIEQTDNPRLIVLDTLAGVKPVKTQQGYTEDTKASPPCIGSQMTKACPSSSCITPAKWRRTIRLIRLAAHLHSPAVPIAFWFSIDHRGAPRYTSEASEAATLRKPSTPSRSIRKVAAGPSSGKPRPCIVRMNAGKSL